MSQRFAEWVWEEQPDREAIGVYDETLRLYGKRVAEADRYGRIEIIRYTTQKEAVRTFDDRRIAIGG